MAKRTQKLTRVQKEIVSRHYMSAKKWRLVKETEFYLYLANVDTGKQQIISKY